ncbi:hypothetical protein HOA92_04325 [archaeon]|nr:hypothetical protein [archaeon]MBT6762241.1 hypothetical protein [archaeon]
MDKMRLFSGRKGAEMWQLVLIIISIIILIFLMIFYGQVDDKIGGVFEKFFGWL